MTENRMTFRPTTDYIQNLATVTNAMANGVLWPSVSLNDAV